VEWRRLRNKQLYALYSSPDIIQVFKSRRLKWVGHVACMGVRAGTYKVLVAKPEGRRPFGTPTRRWENTIKIDLRGVGFVGGSIWVRIGTGGRLL
jgi:hypothetical protein